MDLQITHQTGHARLAVAHNHSRQIVGDAIKPMSVVQILVSFLLAADRDARKRGYVGRRIRSLLLQILYDPLV